MNELKPCPFCGMSPNVFWNNDLQMAQCVNPHCPIYGFCMSSETWQNRPIEYALQARIDKLEDLIVLLERFS